MNDQTPAAEGRQDTRIGWHDGDRVALRPLFSLAEDSAAALDSYLTAGRVLVAVSGGEVVGHLQLVDAGTQPPPPTSATCASTNVSASGCSR